MIQRPEWTLRPLVISSFYLMLTSFSYESTGPVGSMRFLTLRDGLMNDRQLARSPSLLASCADSGNVVGVFSDSRSDTWTLKIPRRAG